MSGTPSAGKLEGDEQIPADSVGEDGSAEQPRVAKKAKGKKKGKGKKRRESVESKGEEHDDEEQSTGKKKGKQKAPPKSRVSSDIQPEAAATSDNKRLEADVEASVTVDEGPKETVVEIQGDEKQTDELEEIVVKKESTLIEGGNVVKEGADSGEGSAEEKTDEKKDSEEESKDAGSEVERATVRRRATLTDLRSESVDKGDGEKAATAGSEV